MPSPAKPKMPSPVKPKMPSPVKPKMPSPVKPKTDTKENEMKDEKNQAFQSFLAAIKPFNYIETPNMDLNGYLRIYKLAVDTYNNEHPNTDTTFELYYGPKNANYYIRKAGEKQNLLTRILKPTPTLTPAEAKLQQETYDRMEAQIKKAKLPKLKPKQQPTDMSSSIIYGQKAAESSETSTTTSGKKILKQVTLIDTPPHGCAVGKVGARPSMEDEHVTASFADGVNLYAVFDGHGGSRVSKFLMDELPRELYNSLQHVDLDNEELIKGTIIDTYARVDATIEKQHIRDGSTAVAILQIFNKLYFINLGDSRAILVNNGKVVHATIDQKPDDERERIHAAGGFVMGGRVNASLAVARAFGDRDLKLDEAGNYMGPNAPVSSVPVITTYQLKPNETYIAVLACDGLWDVMKNEDVAKKLPPSGQLAKVCESLIDEAIDKLWSRDNVSVMITVFSDAKSMWSHLLA
jgi:serine/threonine protein phosphatase PrpC